ncbi:MAG: DUF2007 domain-containing protein [Acidobacteriia bacterium]|nr:DUF2007 domain-containing protein [Terriglobia bacterium]
MKMVFFSANQLEVERLSTDLAAAGIPCQVLPGVVYKGSSAIPCEAELWVKNDADFHRAFLFCVEANAGFAKRRIADVDPEAWHEILAA